MRAVATFTEPSEAQVTISLTGTLKEFEDLRKSIGESDLPFWAVQDLLAKIADASRQLRSKVWAEDPEKSE